MGERRSCEIVLKGREEVLVLVKREEDRREGEEGRREARMEWF